MQHFRRNRGVNAHIAEERMRFLLLRLPISVLDVTGALTLIVGCSLSLRQQCGALDPRSC